MFTDAERYRGVTPGIISLTTRCQDDAKGEESEETGRWQPERKADYTMMNKTRGVSHIIDSCVLFFCLLPSNFPHSLLSFPLPSVLPAFFTSLLPSFSFPPSCVPFLLLFPPSLVPSLPPFFPPQFSPSFQVSSHFLVCIIVPSFLLSTLLQCFFLPCHLLLPLRPSLQYTSTSFYSFPRYPPCFICSVRPSLVPSRLEGKPASRQDDVS